MASPAGAGGGQNDFIGAKISLTSKSDIRYRGTLQEINQVESTITLTQVMSMGTEDRRPEAPIPANTTNVYEVVVFRAADVKDLSVEEPAAKTPAPEPQPSLQDPAIMRQSSNAGPSRSPLPPAPLPPFPPHQQRPPSFPQQPMQPPPPFTGQQGPYGGMPPPGQAPFPSHQQQRGLPPHLQQQQQQFPPRNGQSGGGQVQQQRPTPPPPQANQNAQQQQAPSPAASSEPQPSTSKPEQTSSAPQQAPAPAAQNKAYNNESSRGAHASAGPSSANRNRPTSVFSGPPPVRARQQNRHPSGPNAIGAPGVEMPSEEFDFEQMNKRFEEMRSQETKPNPARRPSSSAASAGAGEGPSRSKSSAAEGGGPVVEEEEDDDDDDESSEEEDAKPPAQQPAYNKSSSFFDSVSSDVSNRNSNNGPRRGGRGGGQGQGQGRFPPRGGRGGSASGGGGMHWSRQDQAMSNLATFGEAGALQQQGLESGRGGRGTRRAGRGRRPQQQ